MIRRFIIYLVIFSISIFSMAVLVRAQSDETPSESELISLDLKGMDIRDVLKILSQKSGLNIVADKGVQGKVDIYLKDVSVMEALDIIVLTNDLAYEQEATLIRIMLGRDYERLYGKRFNERTKTEIVKLKHASASYVSDGIKQMKSRIGVIVPDERSNTIVLTDTAENIEKMKQTISEIDVELVTEIFYLNYAEAEKMKGKLEEVLSKGIGKIRFDERTNKIIVEDTPKKIEEIRKIIEAFDEKNREVFIEANIIEVTLSDKYSYGIDWADVLKWGEIRIAGDTNLSTGITNVTPSTLTVGTLGGTYASVLSLLKTFGETDVLSKPTITVLNNEEAKILVGSKEVYVTSEVTTTSGGTYHTTDHVQFVDVGVTLTVVPTINKEGFVTMKIKPEVSSSDATRTVTLKNPDESTRTVVPYVTTSVAETTVVVKDNTTIVIGGLMKDTIVNHTEKVPFLGDIPLLGKLFSTTGKSVEKTELVVFLTPHIIEGDKTAEHVKPYLDYWEEKRREGRQDSRSSMLDEKKDKERAIIGPEDKKRAVVGLEDKESVSVIDRTPYEEYYLTVKEKIDSIAQDQEVSGLIGEVELQFTLDKTGSLINGPVVLNKPDLKLVRSAIDCVRLGSPFSPFPKDMDKNEAAFYVIVRYE